MRHLDKYIISLLSGTMLLWSCTDDMEPSSPAEGNPAITIAPMYENVDFGSRVSEQSVQTVKATSSTGKEYFVDIISEPIVDDIDSRATVAPTFNSFRLYCWMRHQGSEAEIQYMSDASVHKSEATGSWSIFAQQSGLGWVGNNMVVNYRWPGTGTELAFLGFSPDTYRVSESSSTYDALEKMHDPKFTLSTDPKGTSYIDVNMSGAYTTDMLVAHSYTTGDWFINNRDASTGEVKGVPMTFYHILARIGVGLYPNNFGGKIVSYVKITDIKSVGRFSFQHFDIWGKSFGNKLNGSWSNLQTFPSQTRKHFGEEDRIPTSGLNVKYVDDYIYVIPQTSGANAIMEIALREIDKKEDKTEGDIVEYVRVPLSGKEWKAGYRYLYTLGTRN